MSVLLAVRMQHFCMKCAYSMSLAFPEQDIAQNQQVLHSARTNVSKTGYMICRPDYSCSLKFRYRHSFATFATLCRSPTRAVADDVEPPTKKGKALAKPKDARHELVERVETALADSTEELNRSPSCLSRKLLNIIHEIVRACRNLFGNGS